MEKPTFYFVTYDNPADALSGGRRTAGTFEIALDRMTERQVITDIADGQYENVDRVYLAQDGKFSDITDEIAEAVLSHVVRDGSGVTSELRSWLETHVGLFTTERALVESGLVAMELA